MKKFFSIAYALIFTAAFFQGTSLLKAQTISDFENLPLSADSCWNGSDSSGFFTSGNATFANKFTDWGGGFTSWSGFSYSNKRDTVTQSFTNEFSAITALGFGSSEKYGVCYVSAYDPLPRIRLNGIAKGDTVKGFYITNSTYSYLSMKNGGTPAKKFGGADGTDPDWFVLAVYGYKDGIKKADSVLFYLADFRFSSSAQDYIIKDWQWVDLTSLGELDSLEFNVFSSDTVGGFGINNPTYFCLDNFTTTDSHTGIDENKKNSFIVYPNPANDKIYIRNEFCSMVGELCITDMQGRKLVIVKNFSDGYSIDISNFAEGLYLISIDGLIQKLIIK